MILTTTITTNLIPYLGVAIDILINKCLKGRPRSEKVFQIERKYAQLLNTIFVVFTFGYGIPLLFTYCLIPLFVLTVADKLLLTYWFKPFPI